MDTVIFAGAMIDGTGGPIRHDVAVCIDKGRIVKVGPRKITEFTIPSSVNLIDKSDSTLIPGLVDAHVHVTCPPVETGYLPLSAQGDYFARLNYASLAARTALLAGVTTQRDCGCPDLLSLELRDQIRLGQRSGPRLIVCGTAVTTTAGHGHWIGMTADSTTELRKAVRSLCLAGVDFIKLMASGGSMTPRSNRRAAQYSDEEFEATVNDAHRLQMPVVAHCNPTSAIRQAANFGVDTIAHCNWLGEDDGTIAYDSDVAEMILQRGTFLDLNIAGTLCPFATADGFAMPDTFPFVNRWELHNDLRSRGARLLLTSDEFGVQTASFPKLVARVISEAGVSVVEAIYRSTLLPAKALLIGDEVGSIVEGKKADLVVVAGDLEYDQSGLGHPLDVFKDGIRVENY